MGMADRMALATPWAWWTGRTPHVELRHGLTDKVQAWLLALWALLEKPNDGSFTAPERCHALRKPP